MLLCLTLLHRFSSTTIGTELHIETATLTSYWGIGEWRKYRTTTTMLHNLQGNYVLLSVVLCGWLAKTCIQTDMSSVSYHGVWRWTSLHVWGVAFYHYVYLRLLSSADSWSLLNSSGYSNSGGEMITGPSCIGSLPQGAVSSCTVPACLSNLCSSTNGPSRSSRDKCDISSLLVPCCLFANSASGGRSCRNVPVWEALDTGWTVTSSVCCFTALPVSVVDSSNAAVLTSFFPAYFSL